MDELETQKRKLATLEQEKKDEVARKKKSARQRVLNDLGPSGCKIRRTVGAMLFLTDTEIKQANEVLAQVLAIK